MKKTALFLAVVMVIALVFTACAEKPDNKKIIGSWNASVDMTDKLNESTASFGDITVESFKFDLTFTFNEDGTFALAIDEESFKESFSAIKPTLVSALESSMEAMAEAFGVTVEDLLEGQSVEDIINEAFSSKTFGEALTKDGKYKIEEGKLYVADKDAAEIGESVYFTYEFKGSDELTLNSYVGADEDDQLNQMLVFPLTLKK